MEKDVPRLLGIPDGPRSCAVTAGSWIDSSFGPKSMVSSEAGRSDGLGVPPTDAHNPPVLLVESLDVEVLSARHGQSRMPELGEPRTERTGIPRERVHGGEAIGTDRQRESGKVDPVRAQERRKGGQRPLDRLERHKCRGAKEQEEMDGEEALFIFPEYLVGDLSQVVSTKHPKDGLTEHTKARATSTRSISAWTTNRCPESDYHNRCM